MQQVQALVDQFKKASEEYNHGLVAYQANNFEKAVTSLEQAKTLFQTVLNTPIPEKYADKFKVASDHLVKTFELLLRAQYKLPDAQFVEIQKGFIKLIRQHVQSGAFNEQKLQFLFQSYISCKLKAHKAPQQQQPIYSILEAIDSFENRHLAFLKMELQAIEELNCQDVLFKENILVLQRLCEVLEKKDPRSSDIYLYKTKRILAYLHSYYGSQPVSDSQITKELEEVTSLLSKHHTTLSVTDPLVSSIIPFVVNLVTTFVSCMRYLEKQPSNIDELLSVNTSNDTLSMKNKDVFCKILKGVFSGNLETMNSMLNSLTVNLYFVDLMSVFNKRDVLYITYLLISMIRFCTLYGFDETVLHVRKLFMKPLPSNADADIVKQYNSIINILNDHTLHMNDQQSIVKEKLDVFQDFDFKRRFNCKYNDCYVKLANEISDKMAQHSQDDINSLSKFHYTHCKIAMKYDIQTAYQSLIKSMRYRGMLEKEKRAESKLIDFITKKSTKSELKASFSIAQHFEHTHDFDDVETLVSLVKSLTNDPKQSKNAIVTKFAKEFVLLESTMLIMQNKDEEAESLLYNSETLKNDIGLELQKVILLLKRNDEQAAKSILQKLSKMVETDQTREETLWVKYYCNALSNNQSLNYEFRSNFGLAWNDVPIPLKKRILSHMRSDHLRNVNEEREFAFLSSMSMGIRLKHTLQDLLDFFNTPNNATSPTSSGSQDDTNDSNRGVEKMMRRLSIANEELQFSFMMDLKDLTTKKTFMDNLISILPSNISVCNICISDDYSYLVITVMNNHRSDEDCIVLPISLTRSEDSNTKLNRLFSESSIKQTQLQYHKSSNSDTHLTSSSMSSYSNWQSYQALFGKDNNILHKMLLSFDHLQILSKESFTITDKSLWWKTRKELDEKLTKLCEYVEDLLFGPVKLLLIPRLMNEFDETLEERCDTFINRLKEITNGLDITFDVRIAKLMLKSFSAFREENDLVESIRYFILGDATEYDESIMSEIQTLFCNTFIQAFTDNEKRMASKEAMFRHCKRIESQKIKRKHIVFCLDKLIQQLPVETMPTIKNYPSSRMPSLLLLYYHLNRMTEINGEVKKNNIYYLLNPSGDLSSSEERFKPLFEQQQNWKGIIGKSPATEEDFYQALLDNDLLVYIGHGTGERYYNPHKIRKLSRCCPILLMGCSSGRLKEYGNYEPNGTVLSFLLAGSPFVIANLWDVTDKDIDRLTEFMLEKWLCNNTQNQSVCEVLSKARDTCLLPSLIGAATVCYGLPDLLIN
ncbi:hypothetical protein C9374_002608 [Naegleria lovaniensis]|uniref:separase n=1 Tax=Naegleria lovaniensis TaxID=51637 RepID=A0AA88GSE3_NAELO|nr:uncharacterized protein C9374_002608 [Naegleria lovaniensis]KAG2386162.1 hypothetical protein C9374_002608 [Naegleria lovaniensis]